MISAVRKRELCLNANNYKRASCNINTLYENILKKYNPTQVKYLLEYWQDLDSDQIKAFSKVLDVLDEAYLYDTPSNINTYTRTVTESIIPKVRNATQLQNSIKRRMSFMKSKLSSRVHKKIDSYKKPVEKKLQAKNAAVNQTAANNSYNKMTKAVKECVCYDAIIRNHNILNKRYNIDNFVKESVFTTDQVADNVLEFCELIDTYKLPLRAKVSIALENTLYAYEKNKVPYKKNIIIENVLDYFLFSHEEQDIDMESMYKNILNNAVLYEKADWENLYLFPIHEISSMTLFDKETTDGFSYIDTNNIIHSVNEATKVNAKSAKKAFTAAINGFKYAKNKTPEMLLKVLKKLLVTSPEAIIEGTDSVLSIVFSMFIVALATSYSVVLGILALLMMVLLKYNLSWNDANKSVKTYERHLKRVNAKLDKETPGTKKYEQMEKYRDKIESDLEKLKEHRDSLKSEYMKKKEEEEEDSIEETVSSLVAIDNSVKYIQENGKLDMNEIFSKANSLALDDFGLLAEYALQYPDLVDPDSLDTIFSIQRESVLKMNPVSKYVRSSMISDALYKLENQQTDSKEVYTESVDETLKELNDTMCTIDAIRESVASYKDSEYPLLELSVKNSINMAIERVKKAATGLSEKEKALSKTIDTSFENLGNALTNAGEREDREAIIRGQILPPASRIIKTAIISGATWLVNPALTAIYLIGKFAISKKNRAKERQIILDEIDVELNMCNRYIKEAEEKNDLKAVRRLLMIKKKLEAQRSRLVFKMKTEYKEDVPTNSAGGHEDDDY